MLWTHIVLRDHTHHHMYIDVAMDQPVADVILDKIDGDGLAGTDQEIVLISVVVEPAMAMNVKQVDSVAQRRDDRFDVIAHFGSIGWQIAKVGASIDGVVHLR